MHASVMQWAAAKVAQHDLAECSTLEVGSLNVNGSVRPLFTGAYVGVDMRPGPGVDKVANAADLPFDDVTFEVVVSTEMLEHDATFWLSVPEMARVLAPGGHLLLTTRGIGFPLHEYPHDLWRFTTDAIRLLLGSAGLDAVEVVPDPDPASPGVLAVARKPGGD
jgi:SAM-dependent methyltransferase